MCRTVPKDMMVCEGDESPPAGVVGKVWLKGKI